LRELTRRAVRRWIPAIVWTALIFIVSSIPSLPSIGFRLQYADKVAHAIEFAGLGLFLTVGFRGGSGRHHRIRTLLLVIASGLTIGVLDELYQLTVPGRMVEFLDWVADSVGVVVGHVAATVYYVRRDARAGGGR
jgi:VanZ family protein